MIHVLNKDYLHSSNKKENYECELCFKKYSCLRNLNEHRSTIHLNSRSFKCDLCIYESTNSSNLKIHIKKHHK